MVSGNKFVGDAVTVVGFGLLIMVAVLVYLAWEKFSGMSFPDLSSTWERLKDALKAVLNPSGNSWPEIALPRTGTESGGGDDIVYAGTNLGNDEPQAANE